jgi:hypothetical protein
MPGAAHGSVDNNVVQQSHVAGNFKIETRRFQIITQGLCIYRAWN